MGTYVVGLSLGQSTEHSALCVVEKTAPLTPVVENQQPQHQYAVRHLLRWPPGTPYGDILIAVGLLTARPPLPGSVLVLDSTTVGRNVVDLFRGAQLAVQVVAVDITGVLQAARPQSQGGWRVPKKDLVGVMEAVTQERRFQIVPALADAKTLERELHYFDEESPTGGRLRVREFDDLCVSVSLACWFCERGRSVQIYGMEFNNAPEPVKEQLGPDGLCQEWRERLPNYKSPEDIAAEQTAAEELKKFGENPVGYLFREQMNQARDGWR